MKKALVTGGGGFTGKYLIDELITRGYLVSCLDRHPTKIQGVKEYIGDVTDESLVSKAMKGQNVVFHLAGLLGTSELQTKAVEATQINICGSLNVFNAALKSKSLVVLISKPNPWLNTYSITKEASEKFCQMYQKDFGLKAIVVKWFSAYGPGQKYKYIQKAVPTFIMAALHNKPLPVYGDGKQTADFIYATDLVDTTIQLSQTAAAIGQTIEIGTGKGTKVIDLAQKIINLAQSKSKIAHLPMRMGEDPHAQVVANTTLLTKLLGKRSYLDFDEGLRRTIAYYRKIIE